MANSHHTEARNQGEFCSPPTFSKEQSLHTALGTAHVGRCFQTFAVSSVIPRLRVSGDAVRRGFNTAEGRALASCGSHTVAVSVVIPRFRVRGVAVLTRADPRQPIHGSSRTPITLPPACACDQVTSTVPPITASAARRRCCTCRARRICTFRSLMPGMKRSPFRLSRSFRFRRSGDIRQAPPRARQTRHS